MSRSRLTYRFDRDGLRPNGKRTEADQDPPVVPLTEEEFHVVKDDGRPGEVIEPIAEWDSPFDAETRRIEELIRDTQATGGRGRPVPHRDGKIIIPEEEDYEPETGYYAGEYDNRRFQGGYREIPVPGPRYVRHRGGSSWLKVSASITGAVLTGALLGFLVLQMFAPADTGISKDQEASSADTAASSKTVKTEASASPSQPVSAATVSAVIPARSYTLLQNGNFNTAQAAENAKAELQKKGISAVTESADKHYVYVGIAGSKEAAKGFSDKLVDKKVEIYAKTVSLPSASKVKWNGKTDALQTYLAQSDQLLQTISGVTLVHLEETKPTPIDDATMLSVKKAHDAWTASRALVAEGAPAEAKTPLLKMNNAIDTAKKSLDEYKKTPSAELLSNAQTNLMQFVIAEKDFLKTIIQP